MVFNIYQVLLIVMNYSLLYFDYPKYVSIDKVVL